MASPRFVIMTPPIENPELLAEDLGAALRAADVAAVILRFARAEERVLLGRAKTLVQLVQQAGAAALLSGNFDIVGRSGADGTHVSGVGAELADAVGRFRPEKIVGAGDLRTRHEAMLAGEAGVDYLLFGDATGDRPAMPLPALLDRVAWWAEIFEQPCTALSPSLEAVPALAAAGADFIALGDCLWSESDVAAAMKQASAALEGAAA